MSCWLCLCLCLLVLLFQQLHRQLDGYIALEMYSVTANLGRAECLRLAGALLCPPGDIALEGGCGAVVVSDAVEVALVLVFPFRICLIEAVEGAWLTRAFAPLLG